MGRVCSALRAEGSAACAPRPEGNSALKTPLAIAQVKPDKGDVGANLSRIAEVFSQVERDAPETQLLLLPETCLSGYFLEGGVRDVAMTAEDVAARLQAAYQAAVPRPGARMDVCLGFYEVAGGRYYNSAAYIELGADGPRVVHVHRKFFLPTYGVFDEKRFVSRGHTVGAFDTRFGPAAILICEDVWHSISATLAAMKGAQLLLVVSASPARDFSGPGIGSVARWNMLLPGIADEHNVWVVYAGLVGFEGGKGFTGSSRVVNPWGHTVAIAPVMDDCLLTAEIDLGDVTLARADSPLLADLEAALGDVRLELDAIAEASHRVREEPE